MKIFDSLKDNKWSGKSFEVKPKTFLILKGAHLSQQINLNAGNYRLKILGRRKTGSGKLKIEILSAENNLLLQREIEFGNSNWSEFNFEFESTFNYGIGEIRITRERNLYGSLELSRISLELVLDFEQKKIEIQPPKKLLTKLEPILSEKNIKLAVIIPYHIYGGAEVYIKNIINKLSDQYRVSIFYLNENLLQNFITKSEVTHRRVKKVDQLIDILKVSEYHCIIYYNRADVYETLNQMKENKIISGKLIEIYHSDFVWNGSISKLKSRLHTDKIITVSHDLGLDIDGKFIKEIIPVGLDLNKYSKLKNLKLKSILKLNQYDGVIGTVARLSKEKNVNYLLDLAKEMPTYGFVIVGEGPEQNNLTLKIQEFGLTNCYLLGFQSDVEKYYQIMDAFVLASKIEGTPISILEAMASGVPVFSNMVGAIPSILKDQETGFKIYEDVKIDAEIIKVNYQNQKIISNALNYISQNHNIETNTMLFERAILSCREFAVQRSIEENLKLPGYYI